MEPEVVYKGEQLLMKHHDHGFDHVLSDRSRTDMMDRGGEIKDFQAMSLPEIAKFRPASKQQKGSKTPNEIWQKWIWPRRLPSSTTPSVCLCLART